MHDHIDKFDFNVYFESSYPLSSLEQLLSVLPSHSASLLPEPVRKLTTSVDSPIADLFPVEFEVDLQGKKNEYEGFALIPFSDVSRIRKAFDSVKGELDEYEGKRNIPGKVFTYSVDANNEIVKQVLPQ